MQNHSKLIGSLAGSMVGAGVAWLASKGLEVSPDVQSAMVVVVTGALTGAGSAVVTWLAPANKPADA